MKQAIREASVQFELIFCTLTQHSNQMITVVNADGLVLFQSAAVTALLGYTAAERIGQRFDQYVYDEDKPGVVEVLDHIVLNSPGKPIQQYARVLKKNGGYAHIKSIYTNHLETSGVNAIIINETAITDEQLTDHELIQDHSVLKEHQRLVQATRAAGVAIWNWDILQNQLIWDDAMYRLYGLEPGTALQGYDGFGKRLHPDDRARIAEELQLAIKGEKDFNTEFKQLWPDGSIHYTRAIGFVQRDSLGNALRMGGTNWDITHEKIDEQRLEYANRQLMSLFNSVGEMLVSADMTMEKVIQISPACEKIFGYTPEEFYQDDLLWFNSIHPDDRAFVQHNAEKFKRNEICDSQYRIITKNKEVRWIEEQMNPTLDETGRLIRLDGVMRDITERKIAEEELKKSEHNFQLLVNTIDGIVWEADAKTFKFTFVSKAAERLLGYKVDDWLSSPTFWADHLHPEDRDRAVDYCVNSTLKKRSHEFEYRMLAADGSIVWMQDIVTVILENDEPVCLRGIMTDISGRKSAEKLIRKTEARYRQIVETAQEGIWTIDENDKTNFVNKTMCDILEYTASEMMGKELYDFMDDEGRAYAMECMERRRNGARENLDIRYVTKSGKDVWTNISANPIFNDQGAYKGSLAMVTNITQRKQDEEALKESEANLRTIFNHTDSAYVLINADLKIVSFNALAALYSESENRRPINPNGSILEYFAPNYQPFVNQILNRVLQGEVVNYEISRRHEDGIEKWFDVRWINVTNSDQKHVGYILSTKDITPQKTASLERERIIADLVQRNKDQEQFTYIISHNLRAPVANIMGLTSILKEPVVDEEERTFLMDGIANAVQSLDNVIMDINNVLQVREKLNEKKETVDFHQLMEDIKISIRNTIINEGVAFHCDFKAVDQLFTIRSYLYSIFYNLILNSIKYRRPEAAPQITICSKINQNRIEIQFADNGKGINMEKNSAHLFGLYRRFDTSVEGKGMGLYMVKSQVEALGGIINVKSVVGSGTEFTIQLPL